MELELTPDQPDPVTAAIAAALAAPEDAPPDPWWQAGIEEALET